MAKCNQRWQPTRVQLFLMRLQEIETWLGDGMLYIYAYLVWNCVGCVIV